MSCDLIQNTHHLVRSIEDAEEVRLSHGSEYLYKDVTDTEFWSRPTGDSYGPLGGVLVPAGTVSTGLVYGYMRLTRVGITQDGRIIEPINVISSIFYFNTWITLRLNVNIFWYFAKSPCLFFFCIVM